MFKNYLKIAFRNILRQRVYSLINITGLAIGIACCILILLFVRYELSYDKFNKKADRIYRVTREWFNEDGASSLHLARVAPPIGPLLKNDFPQIVLEETRLLQDGNVPLKVGDKSFIEDRFFWAEQSTFKIFTVHFIEGNENKALSEPKCVVITQSEAKKYFGNEDAIGRTIKYRNLGELKVTGVIKDVPENSHLKYDFLASFITLYDSSIIGRKTLEENWGSNNYLTYVLLPPNVPISGLKDKIPSFIDKYVSQVIRRENGQMPAKALHNYTTLHFQKLTDIHLHSHLTTEV
jgi:putative ABC transport system permease protein